MAMPAARLPKAIRLELEELDHRIKTLLPEEYRDSYETMQPVPMRAAGLKYAADGRVAWNEIWGSFCDLAMAGGPPHKGALLEPASPDLVRANPTQYDAVVAEICRGITMVTDLPADPAPVPGWIRVDCFSTEMAGWLLRAIVMENVAVRAQGRALELPAAPAFRLEKEIKNVITVIAKTSHYWMGHMPRAQKAAVADLFARLDPSVPLLQPDRADNGERSAAEAGLAAAIADRVFADAGLRASHHTYSGWLGVECPSVLAAVWMMRALVVSNVLARREGGVLFVPVNAGADPAGDRVVDAVGRVFRLAVARGVVASR